MKLVWMLAQISTPNQTRSIPSLSATGASSGMMMKAISKKSRKNATTKMKALAKMRKAQLTARKGGEQLLDPQPATDPLEDEAEYARANEDVDHHCREAHGARHSL